MMQMSNDSNEDNGVNDTNDTNIGVSLGKDSRAQQAGPGRQQATARTKWDKMMNKLVMRCYIKSNPNVRGYRKRMLVYWKEEGGESVSEQRLADQARAIRTNGWLSELEIEEIKRSLEARESDNNTPGIEENDNFENESGNVEDMLGERNSGHERVYYNSDTIYDTMRQDGCCEENISIVQMILSEMENQEQQKPPNLRNIERSRLRKVAEELNGVICYINTTSITETNRLLVAAANVAAKRVGFKVSEKKERVDPWWKRRIQQKINDIRKDISRLERRTAGHSVNPEIIQKLEQKYHLSSKGEKVVLEELKQRVSALAAKIKRYEQRNTQYRQNRMFMSNQRRLFDEIEGTNYQNDITPDAEETREFWSGIGGKSVNHSSDAEWLKKLKDDLPENAQQHDIKVTKENVTKQTKKLANWKSPGPDGLQGYWLKNLSSLRERIATQLDECLQMNNVPEWMTKGKTVLIIKDKEQGAAVTNFRPITCLPLMWKVLTGVLSEETYVYLDRHKLLPEEQKGCRKKSRGTKDQLLIDKMIIQNCKRRQTGLGMAWLDFKKAFDMVPHSWIIYCMELMGVAKNTIHLLSTTMNSWKTMLTVGNQTLGEVDIKRGIFQGDSFSPLLFVISLIPLTLLLRKMKAGYDLGGRQGKINHLLFMDDLKLYGKNENQIDTLVQSVRVMCDDIRMEFGVSKCASLVLKKGKLVHSEGISLPNGQQIRVVTEEGYKYLGVLQVDDVKHGEMKEIIRKEYFSRVRKILKSKLNGGNIIRAINSRAVSVIRYSAGIVDWTKEEIKCIDRKTRKLLTIYRALHPQSDVDRLYFKRSEGGRGLISVQDCVRAEISSLTSYISASQERALKAVVEEHILKENDLKGMGDIRQERKDQFKEKPLHGQFFKSVESIADKQSWQWLKKGHLKKETEGLILAAQDQALRTNSIKCRIDKEEISPTCRMCKEKEETISHILSECKMLAQKQYKIWRHDKVAQIIHWNLCGRWGFERNGRWYDHTPEPVLESEKVKILWDFKIQTDHKLEHNRPDIVVMNKVNKVCHIIDIACPFDTRVSKKEQEKVEVYQDLKREITRLWKCQATIVPIVIGALGTLPKGLQKCLRELEMKDSTELLQRAALLGSARILRKVLDT